MLEISPVFSNWRDNLFRTETGAAQDELPSALFI